MDEARVTVTNYWLSTPEAIARMIRKELDAMSCFRCGNLMLPEHAVAPSGEVASQCAIRGIAHPHDKCSQCGYLSHCCSGDCASPETNTEEENE